MRELVSSAHARLNRDRKGGKIENREARAEINRFSSRFRARSIAIFVIEKPLDFDRAYLLSFRFQPKPSDGQFFFHLAGSRKKQKLVHSLSLSLSLSGSTGKSSPTVGENRIFGVVEKSGSAKLRRYDSVLNINETAAREVNKNKERARACVLISRSLPVSPRVHDSQGGGRLAGRFSRSSPAGACTRQRQVFRRRTTDGNDGQERVLFEKHGETQGNFDKRVLEFIERSIIQFLATQLENFNDPLVNLAK